MFSRSFLRASRAPIRSFSTTGRQQLAKIQLVGHLAATPEVTPTSTGTEKIRYNLATSSGPRDNRQTSWWRVTAFLAAGARRDYLMGLEKGTMLYVEGDARMDTFADAEGKNRSALSILHRNVEVLKRPRSEE